MIPNKSYPFHPEKPQLYLLDIDPREIRNLLHENPETARHLMNIVSNWKKTITPGQQPLYIKNEDVRNKIRALGYLN